MRPLRPIERGVLTAVGIEVLIGIVVLIIFVMVKAIPHAIGPVESPNPPIEWMTCQTTTGDLVEIYSPNNWKTCQGWPMRGLP